MKMDTFALPWRTSVSVLDVLDLLLCKQTVGPVRGEFFLEGLRDDIKLPSSSNSREDVVELLGEVFAVFDHCGRERGEILGQWLEKK